VALRPWLSPGLPFIGDICSAIINQLNFFFNIININIFPFLNTLPEQQAPDILQMAGAC